MLLAPDIGALVTKTVLHSWKTPLPGTNLYIGVTTVGVWIPSWWSVDSCWWIYSKLRIEANALDQQKCNI